MYCFRLLVELLVTKMSFLPCSTRVKSQRTITDEITCGQNGMFDRSTGNDSGCGDEFEPAPRK